MPFLRFRGAAQAAAKLREHREQALLCRLLATIALDAPLCEAAPAYARGEPDGDRLPARAPNRQDRMRFISSLHEACGLAYAPA